MPIRNNRNSRDDKSSKTRRSHSSDRDTDSFNRNADRSGKRDWNQGNKSERPSFSGRNAGLGRKDAPSNRGNNSYGKSSDFSNRRTEKKEWDTNREDNGAFDRRRDAKNSFQDKPFNKKFSQHKKTEGGASDDRFNRKPKPKGGYAERESYAKPNRPRQDRFKQSTTPFLKDREDDGSIRLNRYIANSGVCSRRKADELIQAGVVSVNGIVVTELGTKVNLATDEIRYNGEKLKREKMIYVLLNKPKDYITTTDDPQERRTVMHLVEKASKERIYPVGRLDRNTTGLLLLTNDGNLAEKLSHPRNSIMKIYQVELNKNLTQGDFNKIGFGLELEDGFIKPDEVSYVQGASKREIGIQIHSGKNRIVRRIFESLGYDVVKLDRVIYANLTKKDLPRGRWRYLEEREIIQLKHFIK